jgi:hypothetical protein
MLSDNGIGDCQDKGAIIVEYGAFHRCFLSIKKNIASIGIEMRRQIIYPRTDSI